MAFIVDEVQTGGGVTGKMWAHEHWDLELAPDIVTFAKKTQIAGYFSGPQMRPKQGYRIFNTWMGDPAKLLMLEVICEEYKKHDLVAKAGTTGQFMHDGVIAIAGKHPGMIGRVRGKGTFIAWCVNNTETRDAMVQALRQKGVTVGACGAYSIRLRPSMVFGMQHAAEFLRILAEVVAETKVVGEPSTWNLHDPRNLVDVDTGRQGRFHKTSSGAGLLAQPQARSFSTLPAAASSGGAARSGLIRVGGAFGNPNRRLLGVRNRRR